VLEVRIGSLGLARFTSILAWVGIPLLPVLRSWEHHGVEIFTAKEYDFEEIWRFSMKSKIILVAVLMVGPCLISGAQETPPGMVAAYDALADAILATKATEAKLVAAILEGHRNAAEVAFTAGKDAQAAAEMALFANEGDNAVNGIRKRLIEGGHHHNAAGEEKGLYEPGFVIVTRQAKQEALAAVAALRSAKDEAARADAWRRFVAVADSLLGTD